MLVESYGLAAELGLEACSFGLYLRAGPTCTVGPARASAPERVLSQALAGLDDGSPSALGAVAAVACTLGESLWRIGDARAAFTVLLAGVPARMLPADRALPAADLERVPALAHALPAWQRPSALGDPARNLFLAGALAHAAAHDALARALLERAAQAGLPEAERVDPAH